MNCPHCHSGTIMGGRCGVCGRQVGTASVPSAMTATLTPPPDVTVGQGPPIWNGSASTPDAMTQPFPSASPDVPPPLSAGGSVLTAGQTFGSRYHVIRLLGAGGMGAVYQAWDDELGVAVALKVIRPDTLTDPETARNVERRFKRELLLARQVTHKHVVRIHDLGEVDGIKYITMPYVQGSDLASILKREGKLSVTRTIAMARQIAAGLRAAHDVGIVHRDLKPANVMIDLDDQALIMDFGIARSVSGDATALGAVVGTLEYMAPEQAMGQAVDQRADMYAFGLILYDMVVGRRHASRAESAVAELMGRMKEPPIRVRSIDSALPEALDAIITRCLQPDPAHRYQTTAELCADLDALSPEGVGVVRLDTRPQPPIAAAPRPSLSKRAGLYAAAAALVIALAGVPAYKWLRSSGDPAPTKVTSSLAILPFGNATGDQSLDSLGLAIADMVRGQLGQSDRLRIVASDRVHQILRDLRVQAATDDSGMLRRIAEFTNADTIVAGRYFKVGSQIRLAAVIHDPRRESPVNVSAEAASESELLAAVSTLTESIRANLTLTSSVVKELQTRALKPSSQSVQALRLYSEGMDLLRNGSNQEAVKRFEAATAADPNFALAFSKLGYTYNALGFGRDAEKHSSRAVSLSDQLPPEEKYLVLGSHARITGEADKAIDAFQNLAKLLPGDTQVHFQLAKLFQDKGRFDDARNSLKAVLEADPKHLEALVELGRLETRRGQPQAAIDALTRANAIAIQLENDEIRGSILQAHGVAYRLLNKLDDALRYYNESLALRRRLNQPQGVAASLHAIGQVEAMRGQWQAALTNFGEALALRKEIGDKQGTGNVLIDIGNLHSDRGDRDEALQHFKQALQIQREVGNKANEAMTLNNMGNLYLARADYDEAQTYFERALTLREKMNAPASLAATLHNLAEVGVKLGSYDQALDRYVKALGIRRTLGDKLNMAIVLSGQSTLFSYQSRYGAALESAEEAAKLIREAGPKNLWLPKILNVHAGALYQVGRYAEAEAVHKEALEHARQHKNDEIVARIVGEQAEGMFYQGQIASARRLYQQAKTTASSAGAKELEQLLRLQMAKLDLYERQPQRAASTLRTMGGLVDAAASAEHALLAAEAEVQIAKQARTIDQLRAAVAKAERLGIRAVTLRGHYLLMTALSSMGQKADAAPHRDKARELLEEIRKEARSDQILNRADLKPIASDMSK